MYYVILCTIILYILSIYKVFIIYDIMSTKYIFFNRNVIYKRLQCAILSRLKLIDTAYTYIFIRGYLDKLVVKREHVYYHAIKSDIIYCYNCVINNNIRDYELRPLVSINGVDSIDWESINTSRRSIERIEFYI